MSLAAWWPLTSRVRRICGTIDIGICGAIAIGYLRRDGYRLSVASQMIAQLAGLSFKSCSWVPFGVYISLPPPSPTPIGSPPTTHEWPAEIRSQTFGCIARERLFVIPFWLSLRKSPTVATETQ